MRPRLLLAVTCTGRAVQLEALLRSAEEDRVASGLAHGDVVALVVSNETSPSEDVRRVCGRATLPTRLVSTSEIDRSVEVGLGLVPDGPPPLPIGAARHVLLSAVSRMHAEIGGFVPTWMLDDDLRFLQLDLDARGRHEHRRVALLRAALDRFTGIDVALGTYCGDPPIPGFATWSGQLADLAAAIDLAADLGPDAPWPVPSNPRHVEDYYYDHAQNPHRLVFGWEATSPATVTGALVELARAFRNVPHGRQVTRPLVATPLRPPRPSTARGGNTLLLTPRALAAAPFPCVAGPDGLVSRRADSLAALLTPPDLVVREVDLPLLHGRQEGDGSAFRAPTPAALGAFAETQARGIALARSLAAGRLDREAVGDALVTRRALHASGFAEVRSRCSAVLDRLDHAPRWFPVEVVTSLRETLRALASLVDVPLPVPAAAVTDVLAPFLARLPERASSWRRAWA